MTRKAAPPPWKQDENPDTFICHISKEEEDGIDELYYLATGEKPPLLMADHDIKDYAALAPLIEIPEVREAFMVVSEDIKDDGKISPQLKQLAAQGPKLKDFPQSHNHLDTYDPELKHIEDMGTHGDKVLAALPKNLVELFIEIISQDPNSNINDFINPNTGLFMFGWLDKGFKRVVRWVAPVVGGILGGPIGSGLGSLAGRAATGQSGSKLWRRALGDLGKAVLVSGVGGAFNSLFPGMAGSLGSTIGGFLPQSISQGAGQFFTGPMSTMGMLGSLGNSLGLGGSAAGSATEAAKTGSNTSTSSGLFGGAGNFLTQSPLFALAAISGLGIAGERRHQKDMEKAARENNAYLERQRERMGFNKPWIPPTPRTRRPNPKFGSLDPLSAEYGNLHEPAFIEVPEERFATGGYVPYKRGELIKGRGKGQDDVIHKNLPQGGYIYDATTVSDFGDGSSDGGSEVLQHFVGKIRNKLTPAQIRKIEGAVPRGSMIPAAVSNQEFEFDPFDVTALGVLSKNKKKKNPNDEGARILKEIVINLRKQKKSNGLGLPPKAKDPFSYIKMKG